MAGQSLDIELKQVQRLSPLQITAIQLTELPVQALEQRIRKELEENPVLDEERPSGEDSENDGPKEVSLENFREDDSIPSYNLHANNWSKDERPEYDTLSVRSGFTESLMEQLGYKDLDGHEYKVAAYIIGSLDGRGYLSVPIPNLVDDLAFRAGIETDDEEAEHLLRMIQEFEPAGVGARDLRECLLLQLRTRKQTPSVLLATTIIDKHFNAFSNKHFTKIMDRLGIDEKQFKGAMAQILKLNPSPGGQIDDNYNEQAERIVPDFTLEYTDGRFELSLPRLNVPQLRINRKYAEMLEQASRPGASREEKEAALFVKKKMDSAKCFVDAIKQREQTLRTTMQAILDFQEEYFKDGDESALKPMILKDIADRTGFDISTISRVANSKYIQTNFGIFPLKYFFSEGISNADGEEISTREVKKALQNLIDGEDKRKPLTDEQIVAEMGRRGYVLARRTVSKYRDVLGIPTARLRKEIV